MIKAEIQLETKDAIISGIIKLDNSEIRENGVAHFH
jgi:hypothetical protein